MDKKKEKSILKTTAKIAMVGGLSICALAAYNAHQDSKTTKQIEYIVSNIDNQTVIKTEWKYKGSDNAICVSSKGFQDERFAMGFADDSSYIVFTDMPENGYGQIDSMTAYTNHNRTRYYVDEPSAKLVSMSKKHFRVGTDANYRMLKNGEGDALVKFYDKLMTQIEKEGDASPADRL